MNIKQKDVSIPNLLFSKSCLFQRTFLSLFFGIKKIKRNVAKKKNIRPVSSSEFESDDDQTTKKNNLDMSSQGKERNSVDASQNSNKSFIVAHSFGSVDKVSFGTFIVLR